MLCDLSGFRFGLLMELEFLFMWVRLFKVWLFWMVF